MRRIEAIKYAFSKINHFELLLFSMASLLTVIPYFLIKYVPSLDGPQHLYTSGIIVNLVNSDPFISQFFKINPLPVGNWSGHFILSLYNYFLPSHIAEQLLVATYYISIAFAFRYLIVSLRGRSTLLTFFIFPFSSTTLMLLGYYNFSFGTVFLFVTLGFLFGKNRSHNVRFYLVLALLQLLIYFSHVMVYMFFGLIVAVIYITRFIGLLLDRENRELKLIPFIRHIAYMLLSALPAIILWIIYTRLAIQLGFSRVERFGFSELSKFLFDIRSIMAFNAVKESVTSHYLFFTIVITIIMIVFYRLKIFRKSIHAGKIFNETDIWLLNFLVFLILYYSFPDVLTTGNITNRISIIMFFLLITWISLQNIPNWFSVLVFIAILFITYQKKEYLYQHNKVQNNYISELEELEPHVKPHTLLLPVNTHEYWDFANYSCYLGNGKPIVNYADPQLAGQFPVVWNFDTMPMVMFGSKNHHQLPVSWASAYPENGIAMIDYALVCNPGAYLIDTSNASVVAILNTFYKPLRTTSKGTWRLYGFSRKAKLDEVKEQIENNEAWLTRTKQRAIDSKLPLNVMITLEALWKIEQEPEPDANSSD